MNKRCNCDKRKRRRRRTIKRILIAILLALLLHGYISLNANIARQGDKLRETNNALLQTQAELKTVSSRVSTVQAAVVETKVALSTKESAETKANVNKPVGKPVVNVKAKEPVNYVDPVSTFVIGGVLQIGKHVIENGGRIYDVIQ
jgi:hypothetical protein